MLDDNRAALKLGLCPVLRALSPVAVKVSRRLVDVADVEEETAADSRVPPPAGRGRLPRRPLVVVSALAGTTNALLAIAEQAEKGQLIGALRGVERDGSRTAGRAPSR